MAFLLLVSALKWIHHHFCFFLGSCQQKERLRQKEAGLPSSWVTERRRSESVRASSLLLLPPGLTVKPLTAPPPHPDWSGPAARPHGRRGRSDCSLWSQRLISFIRRGATSECPACEKVSRGQRDSQQLTHPRGSFWISSRAENPSSIRTVDVRQQRDQAPTCSSKCEEVVAVMWWETAAWGGKSLFTKLISLEVVKTHSEQLLVFSAAANIFSFATAH